MILPEENNNSEALPLAQNLKGVAVKKGKTFLDKKAYILFCLILANLGQFQTILINFGQCWPIWGIFGHFWNFGGFSGIEGVFVFSTLLCYISLLSGL